MSQFVTALKSYGQHFLHDKTVLERIVYVIKKHHKEEQIVEIGPGMGALTKYLLQEFGEITCVEVDRRCVEYLTAHVSNTESALTIVEADFLKLDLGALLKEQTAIVGNFPYNISSQIIFRILDNYEKIPYMVGMFQREMGHRIASKNVSKEYGVISVLTQLYYDVEVEFDISPGSFSPPPNVMSSVISLRRKEHIELDFDVKLFKTLVKAGFNQRRKMLRNGLNGIVPKALLDMPVFMKRAEQLSVRDFIDLTKTVTSHAAR